MAGEVVLHPVHIARVDEGHRGELNGATVADVGAAPVPGGDKLQTLGGLLAHRRRGDEADAPERRPHLLDAPGAIEGAARRPLHRGEETALLGLREEGVDASGGAAAHGYRERCWRRYSASSAESEIPAITLLTPSP